MEKTHIDMIDALTQNAKPLLSIIFLAVTGITIKDYNDIVSALALTVSVILSILLGILYMMKIRREMKVYKDLIVKDKSDVAKNDGEDIPG